MGRGSSRDFGQVDWEHYVIAREFPGTFTAVEFREEYLRRFPTRPAGSILVSDYAVNSPQKTRNVPRFLERCNRATYCFIGLDGEPL